MLISIDGCIGAGKTTVAKGLASLRGSTLLLEDFEANPFLRAFYNDPIGTAAETEFSFLMLHFHQLKSLAPMLTTKEVVADFHLGKDVLYAQLNLKDGRIQRVFGELYQWCSEQLPSPDLLIFLSASTEFVIDRIRARHRAFELMADPAYYAAVNRSYDELFARYPGKKLRIEMDEWDFARDPALYEKLNALVNSKVNVA